MTRTAIPYGLWPSPISAVDCAAGTRRFGMVQGDGDWVYWTEGRPEENGRQTIMRAVPDGGAPEELLPAVFFPAPSVAQVQPTRLHPAPSVAQVQPARLHPAPSVAQVQPALYSARSRVHEYGGGEFLAVDGAVYFVNDADQDVYVVTPGSKPRRITSLPGVRFADFALDAPRGRLIAVAERHGKGDAPPENLLVAIALHGRAPGAITELASGRDFYAAPRLSPNGRQLAFLAWDLPGMPWDEAALYLADLDADGALSKPRRIAGGKSVAAQQPQWAPDGTLVFISDATGFGNLMAFDGDEVRPLTALKMEFGRPLWSFGVNSYAIDAMNIIWAAPVARPKPDGFGCAVLSMTTAGRRREWHTLAENSLACLSVCRDGLVAIASAGDAPSAITCYTLAPEYGEAKLRWSSEPHLEAGDIATPQIVHFRGGDGRRTYAVYYPPTNANAAAPPKSLPPAIVMAHGGPTASADRGLKLRTQFYTSRGFAVLDVDYAGSTGYGRQYWERLDRLWGIADVDDCVAGAIYLSDRGLAHPDRIVIAGGSAGGYTVLMALATTPMFAAGSSHYGISDLSLLMQHTHKFESGYLHRLLGTTPKAWKKVCRERSPLSLIEGMTAPLILFQGLEDRVVPPEQSRLIHQSLKARGIATELHEFKGEGHGFRRAGTIVAMQDAELAFFLKAIGIA